MTTEYTTRLVSIDQLHLRDDGRTVEGRVVPFNEVAEIIEPDPSTGELVHYREQFLPGSLDRMLQGIKRRGNAAFVPFLLDHDLGFDSRVGYGVDMQAADDGVHGVFKLYDSEHLTKVRSMLTESHTGLSVAFGDIRKPRDIDGVVSRVQVIIGHVAATPAPAYQGAVISAVRHAGTLPDMPALAGVKAWLAENRPQAHA